MSAKSKRLGSGMSAIPILPWAWHTTKSKCFRFGLLQSLSSLGLVCVSDRRYLGLDALPSPSISSLPYVLDTHYFKLGALSSPSVLSVQCMPYPRYLGLDALPSPSTLNLSWTWLIVKSKRLGCGKPARPTLSWIWQACQTHAILGLVYFQVPAS
jgi:hypothetical protein